ncbi:MAG: KOW motif-containing protein [Acutalibacteraceae bacterium]
MEVNYSVGDRVIVIKGSFKGMSGVVKSIDLEREVVTVNLPVMGRDTPTEFALDEVELESN